jgi:hypothetical protein
MKLLTIVLGATLFVFGQKPTEDKPNMQERPMQEAEHAHGDMNARGEQGMGFSQTATTHHFLLARNGGTIQVEAKSASDAKSIESIRMHLSHIAKSFAMGDFAIPMFVHDKVPPGVQEMKRLKERIRYSFEETPTGGRVVIATKDKEAGAAIHKFLRFQIQEHKTGDPMEVSKKTAP